MIVEHHYLRRGRTMAQLPYWITYDGVRCGVLLYALPRLSSKSAKFGSHGPMELIELARMWIDPVVQQRNVVDRAGSIHSLPIASRAIALSIQRVRQDWHGKYPHLPALRAVVAWSDTTLHAGTVYRASNFRHVGTSGGVAHRNTRRPNGGRDQLHADYLNVKDAYLYSFPRAITERQRKEAIAAWEGRRPTRRVRSRESPMSVGPGTFSPLEPASRDAIRTEP